MKGITSLFSKQALSKCLVVFLLLSWFGSWVMWGEWPDPQPCKPPWRPEAILVLGGGDEVRIRQGKRLADEYPDLPVIVTGDGGSIVKGLAAAGIDDVIVEDQAESTYENAKLTDRILERLHAKRVVLVTNWFHAPRALAVFRNVQPGREFTASFEPKPRPLSRWDVWSQRRERVVALIYAVRYGVWSW